MIIQTYTTWESYLVHEKIKVKKWKRGGSFRCHCWRCTASRGKDRRESATASDSACTDWPTARPRVTPPSRGTVDWPRRSVARMRRLLECIQATDHWCLNIAFRANWSLIKNLRWISFRTLTFRRQFSCLQWITQVCYCSCLTSAYAPLNCKIVLEKATVSKNRSQLLRH